MPCHYRTFYRFRGIQLEHDFKFLYGISLLVQILNKHAVGTELFVKHDHGNPFQLIHGDLVWYMEPIAGNQTYFIAEGRAAYKFVRLYISHNESQICLPTFNPMDYLFGRNGIKAEGIRWVFMIYLIQTAWKGIITCHRRGCNPERAIICLQIIQLLLQVRVGFQNCSEYFCITSPAFVSDIPRLERSNSFTPSSSSSLCICWLNAGWDI